MFVGHPLAHTIPLNSNKDDKDTARFKLGLEANTSTGKKTPIIALLPGSRATEIKHLGKLFFQVAQTCWQQNNQLEFLVSAANPSCYNQLECIRRELISQDPIFRQVPIKTYTGQSQSVIRAGDAVLVASGTATLETMLIKRPMTVAYKLNSLSYWLLSRLIKTPYVAQPNWLAEKAIVPEFLQNQATVENLTASLMHHLAITGTQEEQDLLEEYHKIHQQLTSANLARAVARILSPAQATGVRKEAR